MLSVAEKGRDNGQVQRLRDPPTEVVSASMLIQGINVNGRSPTNLILRTYTQHYARILSGNGIAVRCGDPRYIRRIDIEVVHCKSREGSERG